MTSHLFLQYTVNVERFAGLNIHNFSPMKFSWEYFCNVLASNVYYLTIAKYSWENFHGTLKNRKNHECLAQRIFPRLGYYIFTYLLMRIHPYILCMAKYYYILIIKKLTSCKTNLFHCLYVGTVPVHHTCRVANQV